MFEDTEKRNSLLLIIICILKHYRDKYFLVYSVQGKSGSIS